jgi:hypothetical protein
VESWTVGTLRSLPPESMRWNMSVEFRGGMLDGKVKHLPTTIDPPGAVQRVRPRLTDATRLQAEQVATGIPWLVVGFRLA